MTNFRHLFLFAACFFGVLLGTRSAEAVKITVTRVVFEGAKRTEVINLINSTNKAQTYRLEWTHFIMSPDKALNRLDEDQPFPSVIRPVVDLVRFAPRRVTIPPRGSQRVRMMMRAPADLPDGEYRSHLSIRTEAPVRDISEQINSGGSVGPSATISALPGITLPVIVRKGNLTASMDIPEAVARDSEGYVNIDWTLHRSGDRSVYGDLEYLCNPESSSSYLLGRVRGIAVYTDVDHRNFKVRLPKKADESSCRSLSISYIQTTGYNGKRTVILAEKQIPVQ